MAGPIQVPRHLATVEDLRLRRNGRTPGCNGRADGRLHGRGRGSTRPGGLLEVEPTSSCHSSPRVGALSGAWRAAAAQHAAYARGRLADGSGSVLDP